MNCVDSFSSCSCRCGTNPPVPLPIQCGSSQQCAQACLNIAGQCNIMNTQGCCGPECAPFIPTCRCQCGINTYYTTSTCMTVEQCTNDCIQQYGYACSPSNTIGCCNGTLCSGRNRFLGVNQTSRFSFSIFTFLLLSIFVFDWNSYEFF